MIRRGKLTRQEGAVGLFGRIQTKKVHQTLQLDGREVELAGWVYRIVLAPGFTPEETPSHSPSDLPPIEPPHR